MKKEGIRKFQSIIEYIILLVAIFSALLAINSIFRRGLRERLEDEKSRLISGVESRGVPSEIRNESYFNEAGARNDEEWYKDLSEKNIDPNFDPTKYYFHEGATEPDLSYLEKDAEIINVDNGGGKVERIVVLDKAEKEVKIFDPFEKYHNKISYEYKGEDPDNYDEDEYDFDDDEEDDDFLDEEGEKLLKEYLKKYFKDEYREDDEDDD